MPKKILSLALSALLINLCGLSRIHAATKGATGDDAAATADGGAVAQKPVDPKKVEKIKQQIASIGTKSKEFIGVKLRGRTGTGGYVSEIADDHFTLIDKTGAVNINYADVKGITRAHLSTKTMNIVGLAAASLLGVLCVAMVVGLARGE